MKMLEKYFSQRFKPNDVKKIYEALRIIEKKTKPSLQMFLESL